MSDKSVDEQIALAQSAMLLAAADLVASCPNELCETKLHGLKAKPTESIDDLARRIRWLTSSDAAAALAAYGDEREGKGYLKGIETLAIMVRANLPGFDSSHVMSSIEAALARRDAETRLDEWRRVKGLGETDGVKSLEDWATDFIIWRDERIESLTRQLDEAKAPKEGR